MIPALLALFGSSAWACGQSTHILIALDAVTHLPDGPLKALVSDPAVHAALVSGTMFPDGGYSPLTQHPYGETAHWEPFQSRVSDTIAARPAPLDDEGRQLAAFLLGLAAHGMGDQAFDGVYYTRARHHDAATWDAGPSNDEATDVVYVSEVGPAPRVENAVPFSFLGPLFEEHGVPVDEGTMRAGQASLQVAVAYVTGAAEDPATLERYRAQFPWTNAHLTDLGVPGSPACLGEVVARYWEAVYGRLVGTWRWDDAPVAFTWPADGAVGHPVSVADPLAAADARFSLVLARAVRADSVAGHVRLVGPDGTAHQVAASMYYGDGSNVLNVVPSSDLMAGSRYTLRLEPGLTTIDGEALTVPWEMSVCTAGGDCGDGKRRKGCEQAGGAGVGVALGVGLGALAARRRSRVARFP